MSTVPVLESQGGEGSESTSGVQSALPTAAPTAVYRWWQPNDKDWITVTHEDDGSTDASMLASGCLRKTLQFYAFFIGNPEMVAVYRWWQPDDKDWITIPDGSPLDDQMIAWGYTQKTFQFFAYPTQKTGTVPVYRWWHPHDQDWITVADSEVNDDQMAQWGYVNKTGPLFYVFPNLGGYFPMSSERTVMTQSLPWEGSAPHTLSVVEANRGGYRYWGYYGLTDGGDLGLAYSNDLVHWQKDPTPLLRDSGSRWPSVLLVNNVFYMVHDVGFEMKRESPVTYIVLRTSTDGKVWSSPTTLVQPETEVGVQMSWNHNVTLFRDPPSGKFYLYWFRKPWHMDNAQSEIWVRGAATPEGLATADSIMLARSPDVLAAPQVFYHNGTYYMATETYEQSMTYEQSVWKTRILVSDRPDGGFAEIPGNPIFGDGIACFFQHTFNNTLYAYYCAQAPDGTWSLAMRTGSLSEDQ